MRHVALVMLTSVALLSQAGQAKAAFITYQITDILTSQTYTTPDVGQTYAGTGFVGLYAPGIVGIDGHFAHLFGLEQDGFSRTALQVDISALSGMNILSATLSFDLLDGSGASQTVAVTSFTANGNLGYFFNAPDNLGSDNHTVNGQSSNALDVTDLLQDRVDANAGWFGLHLQGTNQFQWTWTHTGFGRDADSANVRLAVEFEPLNPVPAPSALILLATALPFGGYLGLRRRKQAQAA